MAQFYCLSIIDHCVQFYINLPIAMDIEQAIKRRARLGQSFCSYIFKPIVSKTGMMFYKAQLKTKQHNSSKSSLHTMDTICLESSRLKSSTRKSARKSAVAAASKQNNRGLLKPMSRMQSAKVNHSSNQLEKCNIKQNKADRMNQYLADYYNLRKEPELKSNTYENIPKNLFQENSTNTQPFQKLYFSYEPPFASYQSPTVHHSHQKQKPLFSYENHLPKSQFISSEHPQLFYDFGIDQNCELAYTHFKMVDVHSKLMIQSSVSQGIFSQIPMKQFCHSFNNYSTKMQHNIFYVALSKEKLADQKYPYTECFFWISKPIKHNQRQSAFELIAKFYESCLTQMNWKPRVKQEEQVRISISPEQQQQQLENKTESKVESRKMGTVGRQEVATKLWVVDFNGKISFINKCQVELNRQRGAQQHQVNQLSINLHNVQSVCLSMFLSSIKRGAFSHRTIVHQNSNNNINSNSNSNSNNNNKNNNNENPLNLFSSLTNSVVQC